MATSALSSLSGTYVKVTSPEHNVVLVEISRKPVNAFHEPLWTELGRVFDKISQEPEVRVVVLASALPKMFSAGIDFAALANMDDFHKEPARRALQLREHILSFQNAISALERCPLPVIVALHGIALGLSIDIMAACDVRYAASDAVFSIKEVDVGLAADIGTLARLPKLAGNQSLVNELAFTARNFSAVEAEKAGIVSRVVPGSRDEVVKAALETAKLIASKSPVAVVGTKHLLLHSRDHSVRENLEYTATWNSVMLQTKASSTTTDYMCLSEIDLPAHTLAGPGRCVESCNNEAKAKLLAIGGIGLEYVRQLASDPKNVVFAVVRNKSRATQLTVVSAAASNVHVVEGDVVDTASLRAAADEVAKISGGSLDILIHNAAKLKTETFFHSFKDYESLEALDADFIDSFKVNVLGVIHTIDAFLPLLRKGATKKIVVIGSASGNPNCVWKARSSNFGAYSASNGASAVVVAKYAVLLEGEGFTVVSLSPGLVNSGGANDGAEAGPPVATSAERIAEVNPGVQSGIVMQTTEGSVRMQLKVIDAVTQDHAGGILSHRGLDKLTGRDIDFSAYL
ncbi:Delta(3,5)-Delta(2,4)-dienoyl-CoA isomerase, mitochondrial [Grifola frondosa]|uniref:Delta(3,5)-Delta(2,4)-dienoyl-CoA isomerase, mitochondrial n=1 Tax=Grifola frondosa TaxID=5627 RepID=A0A1C7MS01_GRIFR|nr:Delta(3,5)-Delta(2,4)-dienoyl-CoA isomerase, mitochondrial [Grifola frondosa]